MKATYNMPLKNNKKTLISQPINFPAASSFNNKECNFTDYDECLKYQICLYIGYIEEGYDNKTIIEKMGAINYKMVINELTNL